MHSLQELISIKDAASNLDISEELVFKFIHLGLVKPIVESSSMKLTKYNMRRLTQVIDLYEQCYPPETIEFRLNN
jgi:hypothetical protein